MGNNMRSVAIFCLFVGVVVLTAGCTVQTEPKATAPQKSPPIEVKAGDLLKEYASNALAADGKYKGKRIIISGKVDSIRKAPLYGYILQVVSDDPNDLTGIQCILGHKPPPEAEQLKEGDAVKVIGTCDGQVLGQLKISRCELAK